MIGQVWINCCTCTSASSSAVGQSVGQSVSRVLGSGVQHFSVWRRRRTGTVKVTALTQDLFSPLGRWGAGGEGQGLESGVCAHVKGQGHSSVYCVCTSSSSFQKGSLVGRGGDDITPAALDQEPAH